MSGQRTKQKMEEIRIGALNEQIRKLKTKNGMDGIMKHGQCNKSVEENKKNNK